MLIAAEHSQRLTNARAPLSLDFTGRGGLLGPFSRRRMSGSHTRRLMGTACHLLSFSHSFLAPCVFCRDHSALGVGPTKDPPRWACKVSFGASSILVALLRTSTSRHVCFVSYRLARGASTLEFCDTAHIKVVEFGCGLPTSGFCPRFWSWPAMFSSTFLVVCLAAVAYGKPMARSMQVHETRVSVPSAFERVSAAPSDAMLNLRVALVQNDMAGLEKALMDVSDPASPLKGQFLTKEEVRHQRTRRSVCCRLTPDFVNRSTHSLLPSRRPLLQSTHG